MREPESDWPHGISEEHKRSAGRLLRRLKIALIIWLISLIATVVWFSFC